VTLTRLKMIGNDNFFFITPKSCTAVFPNLTAVVTVHTGKNTQRISHHITTAANLKSEVHDMQVTTYSVVKSRAQ